MAVRVKDLSASSQRYSNRASAAATDYASEAQSAADRWSTNTGAASQTFLQAVSAAGVQERFRRGVQRAASMGRYSNKIAQVGQARYSSGVQNAADDWRQGFEPFANTISALTLPQRRPRGDPGNLQRVTVIAQALNARRLAGMS